MRPVLYSVHLFHQELALHSYGVAIAVGFLTGIFLAGRQARRLGEQDGPVLELCFWLLVSSMLGARLLFVLTNLGAFTDVCSDGLASHSLGYALWSCTRALHVWEGGLVFYGGFLAAAALAVWYTHRRQMSFPRTADLLAPSVALGHFFGRLGCFAAGCCWGTPAPTGLPWAMRFPADSLVFQQMVSEGKVAPSSSLTPPLHPVQLYEALANLALYFALSRFATRKRYDGQVLVWYLLGYGAIRFAVELFRGDTIRKFVLPGLSTSQAIALGTVPLALWCARHFRRAQLSRPR